MASNILVDIGWRNGLSHVRHQAVIQTNDDLLSRRLSGANFSEIANFLLENDAFLMPDTSFRLLYVVWNAIYLYSMRNPYDWTKPHGYPAHAHGNFTCLLSLCQTRQAPRPLRGQYVKNTHCNFVSTVATRGSDESILTCNLNQWAAGIAGL